MEYFISYTHTGLSSLRVLHLIHCTSLATLSSLPTTLEILMLEPNYHETDKYGSLESVEDASLPNLRHLAIMECPKLKRLALHATSLEKLFIAGCVGLEDLDCKGLSSLRGLLLDDCTSLATLSSLPTTLEILSLKMNETGSLESVEDSSLPNLRDLTITCCPKLKRLALHATSLEKLYMTGCVGLEDLGCKGLSSLRVLALDGCTSLATLSSLPKTLESLSLKNPPYKYGSLESVEDASLPNLTDLTIWNCPKLKRLALHATSLEKLYMKGCVGLEDLDCKALCSLQTLNLRWCGKLEFLDIDGCTRLKFLDIRGCIRLNRSAIHGWDRIRSLPSVHILGYQSEDENRENAQFDTEDTRNPLPK
ncbi:hypothetical protein KP509_08G022400 [Ceratopteris richardii]|uniref:Uncharacterized protein n=1 Tax=Ceratopteris richardii TaxID=49495 RepID=A0A8T2UES6_CERRI|nr:hypothetical protein KP509_08G022400 [Ceratopteris richardii]